MRSNAFDRFLSRRAFLARLTAFRSATFKLRRGIKFHNGEPVTPEDVKFTFEKYRGASAKVLHDKTQRVDVVDDRTIRFVFKEPFLDFMILYGTPASGTGWIVPKQYHEQVGPNGFKQKPIGAGPRVANKPTDVLGAIPHYPFAGPYEDIVVKA